jgi:purine-nucleoside phosphorylase
METAHDLYDRAADAANHIRGAIADVPKMAVVIGSGLAEVGNIVADPVRLPYADIPNFPPPMTVGHQGELLVGGGADGEAVAVLSGRAHLYEGYTVKSVTFPVRVMQLLGVRYLIVTNAAGGIAESFSAGDLMAITDQINLTGQDPLAGDNDPRLGERFLEMSRPFDEELLGLAQELAPELGISLHTGVYAGVHGPAFETPAEIEYLRRAGADAVGMSTVNEVIAARHAGMRVLGLSVISNVAGDPLDNVAQDVLAASAAAAGNLRDLVAAIISRLPALERRID